MYANYRDVAARFGLTMTPADPGLFTTAIELAGEVGDHPVRIRRLIGMHTLETEIHLKPAFDLGLDLTPAGQSPYPGAIGLRWLGRLFSRADLHVGDTELDDAFSVHGDEEARVRTLLEPLRAPLLAWHASRRHFHVTDSMVCVRRYSQDQYSDQLPDIVGDVDTALDLARRLEAQRTAVGPATILGPQIGAFEAFAAARSTSLLLTPLVTWGTLRGRPFWAGTRRVAAHGFEVAVSIELVAALPEGLRVISRAVPEGTTSSGGAPDFDSSFRVSGLTSPALVSDPARAALVGLRAAGHRVEVSERGLYARRPLDGDTYDLDAHVSSAEEALDALERAFAHHAGYR